jgi:hypothetical protein
MWQRFTMSARDAIMVGQNKALELQRDCVGTDLILWALVEQNGAATQVLQNLDAHVEILRGGLEAAFTEDVKTEAKAASEPRLTAGAKRVLEYSAEEAHRLNKPSGDIGSEHILLGLLRLSEDRPLSYTLLHNAGVTLEAARLQLQQGS